MINGAFFFLFSDSGNLQFVCFSYCERSLLKQHWRRMNAILFMYRSKVDKRQFAPTDIYAPSLASSD